MERYLRNVAEKWRIKFAKVSTGYPVEDHFVLTNCLESEFLAIREHHKILSRLPEPYYIGLGRHMRAHTYGKVNVLVITKDDEILLTT